MNAPMELDRMVPQAIDAEQRILGGLLLDGEPAWDKVADILSDHDFYRDDHRRIFRTIRGLAADSKPFDVFVVTDALTASNEADLVGGLAYLLSLVNATPSSANLRTYADIVIEKSRKRRVIALASEIMELSYRPNISARDVLDQAAGLIDGLGEHTVRATEPKHISEVMIRATSQIESRIGLGEVFGLQSGFIDLDKLTGGMHAGDLVIVAGRPSMGKTAFAINVAENVALGGKSVLVFSLEMSDTQIAMRNLSSIGGASIQRVRSGSMTEDEWDKFSGAMGRLHQSKLWIDDASSLSAAQMHSRARTVKRKHGLDLIVVDYLQLMTADGENRVQQLGEITRRMKLMARQLNVPVVLLSQLSRKVEERTDKRPMMSDLRESGSIEQDADVILMVYRDDYYNSDSKWRGYAELGVVKNRMGETGVVRLVFQGEFSRFRTADRDSVTRITNEQQSESRARPRRGFA